MVDFRVDFAEDTDLFAVYGKRGSAAGDERGVVDGGIFGRPAKLAEEGIDGAAGVGVAAFFANLH